MKTKAKSHTGTGAAKNRSKGVDVGGYAHGGIVGKTAAQSHQGTGVYKNRTAASMMGYAHGGIVKKRSGKKSMKY